MEIFAFIEKSIIIYLAHCFENFLILLEGNPFNYENLYVI